MEQLEFIKRIEGQKLGRTFHPHRSQDPLQYDSQGFHRTSRRGMHPMNTANGASSHISSTNIKRRQTYVLNPFTTAMKNLADQDSEARKICIIDGRVKAPMNEGPSVHELFDK